MHALIDTLDTFDTRDAIIIPGGAHLPHPIDALAKLTAHATITNATYTQLVRSRYNVRTKQTDVTELAALIRTHGLLQNLVGYRQMVDGVATGIIEVVAGGRRLAAIGQLIESGDLPHDFAIPLLIVTEDEAIELSLAENLGRADMHPADLYVAMQAMIDHGRAIEDVALRFELEATTVKRYLKLANVAPRLIDLYRDGVLNFEHMMALALVDDHAAQEQAWDSLPAHSRQPYELRRLLTGQKINTQTDRVARFVGVRSFEAAGGTVERDLFSRDNTGYISDAVLLDKLALDKLAKQAKQLRKDGVAWVELVPRADHADLSAFGRVRISTGELSDADRQAADALQAQIAALDERIDDACNDDNEALAETLDAERDALCAQRDAVLARRTSVPHPDDAALAGAVLYLDHDGKPVVLRDVIRPADVARRASAAKGAAAVPTESKRVRRDHSDRLTLELTSQRTLGLQAEMIDQPDTALAYLTYTLMRSVLLPHHGVGTASLSKISLGMATLADNSTEGAAGVALAERREQLLARLPDAAQNGQKGQGGWLAWLQAQPQPVVLELLAFCVAASLDATLEREKDSPEFVALGKALNLDMTKWWRATAASYFDHVPRECTVKVVTEAVSATAALPLEKLPKQAAAEAAERAVADAGWLPAMLRTA